MTKRTSINSIIRYALFLALLLAISHILQISLAIPLFLLSLFGYIKLRNLRPRGPHLLLHLALLFSLNFVTGYLVIRYQWPVFYIPFCAVPMLTTLLFNQLELSLLISLSCALSIASVAGNNLYISILFFISGIASSMLVLGKRSRMPIIQVGFITGVIQTLTLFFITGFNFEANLPVSYLMFIINGIVSSIIALGVLPLFEYLFKSVTNISLLELADCHHPLLQRMISEAPGTYHHSLVVGNLSEAACSVIGANALLARIGSYYHDIGKLQKPDYFSENQNIEANKHDTLSPAISKMVIMNHVKEGIELAKKYQLNAYLIDFIQQHHGNSLVYYFYRRALEGLEEDELVREEGFRYPGPKPNTKETAVVLLADSVEAATRALKDPTPAKIEEVVHRVINNKFIDGQLDECDLTLRDLERISAVFIRILSSVYHNRVTYP